MRKRFIVLIDFSPYSENLLRYAGNWSRHIGAELVLVHQITILASDRAGSAKRDLLREQAVSDTLDALGELGRTVLPPGLTVGYRVSDEPMQDILNALLAEPFDQMILAGLKGTGLLKQIFIGSTVVRIIEQADHTVVAIPKEVTVFSPQKLYVAVSDKHPLHAEALDFFLDFAGEGIENLTFFYLAKPGEPHRNVKALLAELKARYAQNYNAEFAVYEGDNAFDDIKTVINNAIEEMLIVQKGSRLLTDRLFRKFLVNELVYEGRTPLVVLP